MPTLLLALILSERFTILDDTGGRPRFSNADQLRINEIDKGFNRAIRLGETVFTLSGMGWWLTVLVLVTLTACIFVVLPSKLGKRTPGQILLSSPAQSDSSAEDQIEIEVEGTVTVEDAVKVEGPIEIEPEIEMGVEVENVAVAAETEDPEPKVPEVVAEQPEPDALKEPDRSADRGEAALAAPISLGDPADYRDWDHQEASIVTTPGAPTKGGSYDTLTLSESSLAESPLNVSSVKTGVAAPTADSPIWSELWNAWLFWDPASDRWFRHDTDSNSWKPLK